MTSIGRTRPDTPLEETFDAHYPTFWEAELAGERLTADVELIRMLGRFTPSDELLDLGCGYGRLTNALTRAGLRVSGMDLSAPLLRRAREEAATESLPTRFVPGDMRAPLVDGDGTYDGVLLWFTSFGYFGHDENRQVLATVHDALRPCGRLLLETRHWDRTERQFEPTTVRSAGDNWLIERHTYLPESGVQQTHQTLLVEGGRIERTSSVRRYGFPELAQMCYDVGYAQVHGFGEDGQRLTPESTRCVLVASRGRSRCG